MCAYLFRVIMNLKISAGHAIVFFQCLSFESMYLMDVKVHQWTQALAILPACLQRARFQILLLVIPPQKSLSQCMIFLQWRTRMK